jgi:photosystem II stability/assembly factor-like uncharacterized protein
LTSTGSRIYRSDDSGRTWYQWAFISITISDFIIENTNYLLITSPSTKREVLQYDPSTQEAKLLRPEDSETQKDQTPRIIRIGSSIYVHFNESSMLIRSDRTIVVSKRAFVKKSALFYDRTTNVLYTYMKPAETLSPAIYRSDDTGKTWKYYNKAPFSQVLEHLIVDDKHNIHVNTGAMLLSYYSTAKIWKYQFLERILITNLQTGINDEVIATFSNTELSMMLGTYDNGATWQTMPYIDDSEHVHVSVIKGPDKNVLIFNDSYNNFYTTIYNVVDQANPYLNEGMTIAGYGTNFPQWKYRQRKRILTTLLQSPYYDKDVFNQGLFISRDNGNLWEAVVIGKPVAYDAATDGTIYHYADKFLSRSTNGGTNWREVYFDPEPGTVTDLCAISKSTLLVGTSDRGLLRSDSDLAAMRIVSGSFFDRVNKIVLKDEMCYVCTDKGLFVYYPQTDTWSMQYVDASISNVTDILVTDSLLYVVANSDQLWITGLRTTSSAAEKQNGQSDALRMYIHDQSLIISGTIGCKARIQLYDIMGRSVMMIDEQYYNEGDTVIPLPKLRTGMYVVKLTTEAGVRSLKFMGGL